MSGGSCKRVTFLDQAQEIPSEPCEKIAFLEVSDRQDLEYSSPRPDQVISQIEQLLKDTPAEEDMSDGPEIPVDPTEADPAEAEKPKKNQKPSEPPVTFREFDVRTVGHPTSMKSD